MLGLVGLEPTTYGSKHRNPYGRLAIGHFVRGSLILADPARQRLSFWCAINVPLDLRLIHLMDSDLVLGQGWWDRSGPLRA